MIDVESLYEDTDFIDFLIQTASKNLLEFDDYRQDVFVEIIESNATTLQACKRAAWRIRDRRKKYEIEHRSFPLIDDESVDDADYHLWEDRHIV